MPCVNEYRHWLHDPEAPKTMETFCRQPLYITLREHFCYVDASGPEKSGRGKDIDDAWLPSSWAERDVSHCVFHYVLKFSYALISGWD